MFDNDTTIRLVSDSKCVDISDYSTDDGTITSSQSAVIDHCSFKQQSSKNASVTDYEPQVMQIS